MKSVLAEHEAMALAGVSGGKELYQWNRELQRQSALSLKAKFNADLLSEELLTMLQHPCVGVK